MGVMLTGCQLTVITKMATPMTEDEKSDNLLPVLDDLHEFESCIDENDALADLENFVMSDDEYFVDIDIDDEASVTEDPNVENLCCSTSVDTDDAPSVSNDPEVENLLCCLTCGKRYKKESFLTNHQSTCSSAGRAKRKKVRIDSDQSSVANVGKYCSC